MRPLLYILDDAGNPVPEKDPIKWAEWRKTHREQRALAQEFVGNIALVSTIFTGVDAEILGAPCVFETGIFRADGELYIFRYCSREEALDGHKRLVAQMRESNGKVPTL